MKIKKLKKIKILAHEFKINWSKEHNGGWFDFGKMTIEIGIQDKDDGHTFMVLCHELMEICAVEMGVRLNRPDCTTDFIFVYDHRQFETKMSLFSSLITQFLE